ncbi:MAG: TRAP transporter small permease subunit [Paracoccaceae bacterium]|nr:TRAP transporter small permease subunit [Paracoccaceae bacterium]MDE3123636.1 TRAP transporter small permease subunit [Paracoccaceae bacterium]
MTGEGETTPGRGRKGRRRPFPSYIVGLKTLIEWSGKIVSALCLGVLFAALLANVILRYAFDSGITWAYEIHALLLPWLVAGGVVIAAARGRNIAITLLPDVLGGRGRQILMLAVETVALVISVTVLLSSRPILMAAQYQTYSTLPLKQIWGYASLIYAFSGLAAIAVLDILRLLAGQDVADRDPGHASLS